MRNAFLAVLLTLALATCVFAGTKITPTTTLTAETSNNTSTADSYQTDASGNLGASNISKVDIRTLLYSGATTPIYVHFMGWFGTSSHINVGYTSWDSAQVHRQVDDMLSRGITGAILDWYGPNHTTEDSTAKVLKTEAESRNGEFVFGIMEDKGALKACAATAGCDLTQQLISDLTYAYNNYETSSAYMRVNGRPLVFFFDVEQYTINWDTVVANVPGNPLFIFRNAGGFTKPHSAGSFGWMGFPDSYTDWGQAYLDYFYSTSLNYPALNTFGTGYKGFNDTLASWGQHRLTPQDCGHTWMASLNEIGKYYSSTNQLDFIQLVTWNDYEEGTELESGIDNCVTVSGSTTGNTLNWSITGQENTIDHYTVFISTDGYNLMPLADVAAGTHTFDLSSYGFDPGSYTIYVKAVGKPSLKNQMSAGIGFSIADQPPVASLSVTPTSGPAPLTVTASTAASTDPDGTIASSSINFGDGTIVSGPTASHTYNTPGTYTITGTVTDNGGLSASATSTVTVQAPLVAFTLTVSSPTNGASLYSPVHFLASTTSPYPVTGMKIYVDSVVAYATSASSIDTNLTMTAGSHYVVVKAWNTTGAIARQDLNITVLASFAPYVTISSPTSGTTLTSPVHVKAAGFSMNPVTAMRIYVDNVSVYTVNAASVDTYVTMVNGTHTIVVQAWDSTGAVFKSSVTINVKKSPPPKV